MTQGTQPVADFDDPGAYIGLRPHPTDQDWVLVLDDAQREYPPPGRSLSY